VTIRGGVSSTTQHTLYVSGTVITFVTPPLPDRRYGLCTRSMTLVNVLPNSKSCDRGWQLLLVFLLASSGGLYRCLHRRRISDSYCWLALNLHSGVGNVVLCSCPGVNSVVFAVYDNTVFLLGKTTMLPRYQIQLLLPILLTVRNSNSLYVDVYVNRLLYLPWPTISQSILWCLEKWTFRLHASRSTSKAWC